MVYKMHFPIKRSSQESDFLKILKETYALGNTASNPFFI